MPGIVRRLLDTSLAKAGYVNAATVAPYIYNAQPERYGTPTGPRGTGLTFAQLQDFADHCDPVRDAIMVRQAQVLTTPIDFRPRDKNAKGTKLDAALEVARAFTSSEGGLGGPGTAMHEFLCKTTEDLLVGGCCAQFRLWNRGSEIISVSPIDAFTIKPLVADTGQQFADDEPAYEQWINGRKVGEFTRRELHYRRLNPRTRSRWGRSPVEFVANAVQQFMGYDDWNLSWVRHGDGDFGHWEGPKDASRSDYEAFKALLKALSTSGVDARQKGAELALQPGWAFKPRRQRQEAEFEKTQTFLIRRIAAGFQINATVIGFAGEQYKASQEGQKDLAEDYGEAVFKLILTDLLNDILAYDLMLPEIEAYWKDDEEERTVTAQVVKTAGHSVFTPNEARKLLGQEEAEGPFADALFLETATGPIILGWPEGKEPVQDVQEQEGASGGSTPEDGMDAPGETGQPTPEAAPQTEAPPTEKALADMRLWRRKALKYLAEGHLEKCEFVSDSIAAHDRERIEKALDDAQTGADVRAAFGDIDGERRAPNVERLADDLQSLLGAVQCERGSREARGLVKSHV